MRLQYGLVLTLGLILTSQGLLAAETPEFEAFNQIYRSDIRALIIRDCQKCHSDKLMEADIDLSIFTSITEIRNHHIIASVILGRL